MNVASQLKTPAVPRTPFARWLRPLVELPPSGGDRLPWNRLPQILLVAVTTAVGSWAGGRWLSPVGDTGFSWSLAYRLGQGELLYRDVYLAYGPLTPYVLALTGRPFGFSSLWYLLANWVAAIAAAWLLLECGRRCLPLLGNIALLILLLGFALFPPGTGRLVLPYYAGVVQALAFALGAMLLIVAPRQRSGARPLSAGLLAGLAFSCKPEVGVAALAGLLFAAVAGLPKPVSWMARVTAGFSTVAAAVFLFAISCDSLASLRSNSHLWPLSLEPPPEFSGLFRSVAGLSNPQWPLLVRSAAFRALLLIGELTLLAMLLARERVAKRWRPLAVLAAVLALWFGVEGVDLWRQPSNALCLSMLASFLVAALALLRKDVEVRPFLAGLGVFAGLVGTRTAFSGSIAESYDGPAHFVEMLTWVALLTVLLPPLLTGGGAAAAWARGLFAAAVILIATPHAWTGIQAMRAPSRVPLETPRGRIFLEAPQARLFRLIGAELHPGESLLVLPEVSAVDVLFGVRSASPFLHLLPGWLTVGAERSLIAGLDRAPPDAVVLFERPTGEYGIEPFGRGFGVLLWEWCRQRYAVVAETAGGAVLRPRRL